MPTILNDLEPVTWTITGPYGVKHMISNAAVIAHILYMSDEEKTAVKNTIDLIVSSRGVSEVNKYLEHVAHSMVGAV